MEAHHGDHYETLDNHTFPFAHLGEILEENNFEEEIDAQDNHTFPHSHIVEFPDENDFVGETNAQEEGFWTSFLSCIILSPQFICLLLLGLIKGAFICPLTSIIITIGNTAVILGLWPIHVSWTCYSVLRAKQLGPVLKIITVLFGAPILVLIWPVLAILGSLLFGAGVGILIPLVKTFEANTEENKYIHFLTDGTWITIPFSFDMVNLFAKICSHVYFKIMKAFRHEDPPESGPYEIRLFRLIAAVFAGILGIIIDVPIFTLLAVIKSPALLVIGWKFVFQELFIGHKLTFLSCSLVPLAILFWPAGVAVALVLSAVAGYFFGAYASILCYQESSFIKSVCYIIASLSLFDEWSNGCIGLSETFCIPRPYYDVVF